MVLINDNSTVLQIGDAMPKFSLPDAASGTTVDVTRFDASAYVIIFTCNHCPYAKAVESRLIGLQNEFAPKNVRFVLICSNDPTDYPEDSFEELKKRALNHKYPFPYCQDESQGVAKAYGALCTPHCFVFDHDRKLRYKGRVDDNWKDESKVIKRELRDAIMALVDGNDPPVAEANAMGCSIKWKS